MPQDQLRTTIDGIRARLQEELEAQLATLSERQEQAFEGARRAAEAEAEQRWASKVEAVRAEWTARLESEVSAARAEAERRMVAESMRLRVEAEQSAAESAARVREELEQALSDERQRAVTQIEEERRRAAAQVNEERQRATAQVNDERQRAAAQVNDERQRAAGRLEQERARLEREIAAEREKVEAAARLAEDVASVTEARVSEREAQLATVERLLSGVRSMDAARSLSDALAALLRAVAAEAPRAALFIINGQQLQPWKHHGFADNAFTSVCVTLNDAGLLGEAIRTGDAAACAEGEGPQPPAFASLPHGRAALAVPMMVGGVAVAVLYADDGSGDGVLAPSSWPEAVQILGRHGSSSVAHLTAVRTAQAQRLAANGDEDGSARRYARLLVSEIKLYNEPAVREGRQYRDLLARLAPEIERARRMYEEKISTAVPGRSAYFQQELVQTLADGDPSLLGGPA